MVNYSITEVENALSGKTHYFASPQIRETISTKNLAKTISAMTTVTLSDTLAVLTAISQVVISELRNGNQAELEGIGKLRLSLKSKNADSREEFTASNIRGAVVRLVPSEELEDIYNGMEFNFVPSREEQAIARRAAKAGQTITGVDDAAGAGDVE